MPRQGGGGDGKRSGKPVVPEMMKMEAQVAKLCFSSPEF
jgi:hypothetical protein